MAGTWMLFCTTLLYCWGRGKGLSSGKKGFLPVKKEWQRDPSRIVYYEGVLFTCELFLVPSVIFVTIAVCFLTSLLFSANFSYLSPWSLPFVPPILSILLWLGWAGEKRGSERGQCGWESLTVGIIPKS